MTFQLNENQEMCRDLARDFAEKQCRPRIEEFEKNNSCPKDIYKLMGDIGLLGIVYDEKYGGMGLATTATPWSWRSSARPLCAFPPR
mgnify:CR=1 FL=1